MQIRATSARRTTWSARLSREHRGRPGRPDRGWASALDDLLRHV